MDGRLDLEPPADAILARMARWPPLGRLGLVRQGIVENPAAINAEDEPAVRQSVAGRGRSLRAAAGRSGPAGASGAGTIAAAAVSRPVRPGPLLCRPAAVALADLFDAENLERRGPVSRTPRSPASLPRGDGRTAGNAAGLRAWWQLHWPREEMLWRKGENRRPADGAAAGLRLLGPTRSTFPSARTSL